MRIAFCLLLLGGLAASAPARAQGLSGPELSAGTTADAVPLVPLHVGAEWQYAYGDDWESSVQTYRIVEVVTVEGVEWHRVENEGSGGPPIVYYWRNAPEGFYEATQFTGDTLEEALGLARFFKHPEGDGEAYVARSLEDGEEQRMEIHRVDLYVGHQEGKRERIEVVCYTPPPDEYSSGGYPDGELQEGDCFVPGIGRVLHTHPMFSSTLITEDGSYWSTPE